MSLFPTLTAQSWRVAIARSRTEPNLVLQKINQLAMTNTVTMDDQMKLTVLAWSAADAIQSALTKHLGHKVAACYSGLDTKYGGTITYEIPAHVALTEKPKRPTKIDNTEPMFDPEEIRKESEAALYWAGKK